MDRASGCIRVNAQVDPALSGELHGVVEQVEQHLPQPVLIAEQPPRWTCSGLMESGLVVEAPLELDRAGEAQRRVTAAGIVEAIDVTGQRDDGFRSRLERGAPDQLVL